MIPAVWFSFILLNTNALLVIFRCSKQRRRTRRNESLGRWVGRGCVQLQFLPLHVPAGVALHHDDPHPLVQVSGSIDFIYQHFILLLHVWGLASVNNGLSTNIGSLLVLVAQGLAHRADDQEVPGSSPTQEIRNSDRQSNTCGVSNNRLYFYFFLQSATIVKMWVFTDIFSWTTGPCHC